MGISAAHEKPQTTRLIAQPSFTPHLDNGNDFQQPIFSPKQTSLLIEEDSKIPTEPSTAIGSKKRLSETKLKFVLSSVEYGDSRLLCVCIWTIVYPDTAALPPPGDLPPLIVLLCKSGCINVFIPGSYPIFWRHSCDSALRFCAGGRHTSSSAHQNRNHKFDQRGSDKRPWPSNNTHPTNTGASGSGNGGGGSNSDTPRDPDGKESLTRRFACPFHKLDPSAHERCEHYVLSTWRCVLQHLRRNHLLFGDRCPVCRIEFEGQYAADFKDYHLRTMQCESVTIEQAGWLLEEEYDNLKNLGGHQEHKWYQAWGRLFPDLEAPQSPFFESHVGVLRRHAPQAMRTVLESRYPNDEDLETLAQELAQATFRVPTTTARDTSIDTAPQIFRRRPQTLWSAPAPVGNNSWSLTPSEQPPEVLHGALSQVPSLPLRFDSYPNVSRQNTQASYNMFHFGPPASSSGARAPPSQAVSTRAQTQSGFETRHTPSRIMSASFSRSQQAPDGWRPQVAPSRAGTSVPQAPYSFDNGLRLGSSSRLPSEPSQMSRGMDITFQQFQETPLGFSEWPLNLQGWDDTPSGPGAQAQQFTNEYEDVSGYFDDSVPPYPDSGQGHPDSTNFHDEPR